MANGYAGKILRVNLTTGIVSTINTSDYEGFIGGHGMGAAIFWDLAVAPGDWDLMDAFDSRNVVTLMVSPLAGTLCPFVGRTEVNGIGPEAYPIGWFTRSGFGGRFAAQLKFAGCDGIVVEGKASSPVWINIVNDNVTLEDAGSDGYDLWGLNTWETQEEIWNQVTNFSKLGEWLKLPGDEYTTQKPAVVTIGKAGETLSRIANLQHEAGHGAGQGGFGGVFGSKNLKAISVLGTGSVEPADPGALTDAMVWLRGLLKRKSAGSEVAPNYRATGCTACPMPHTRHYRDGNLNDQTCIASYWYRESQFISPNIKVQTPFSSINQRKASDSLGRWGVNACDPMGGHAYLNYLVEQGVIGPGTSISTEPLLFDQYRTLEFAEGLLRAIANREGIGDDLSNGIMRTAEKWGRLEEDLDSGYLNYTGWGYFYHFALPYVCWAYSDILESRDTNEHSFQKVIGDLKNYTDKYSADDFVNIMAERLVPYQGDTMMMDYSDEGIYSASRAKTQAWYMHYGLSWKNSVQFCDQSKVFPQFIEAANVTVGTTPEAEPKFYNAVTGKNVSFADVMEVGRKVLNLDKAIWVLQGRHRDMEVHPPFMNKPGAAYGGCGTTTQQVYVVGGASGSNTFPVYQNGQWGYEHRKEIILDVAGFEEFKTHFFELEGWDTSSGWPTRVTLEGLGLGYVADRLEAAGKLGA